MHNNRKKECLFTMSTDDGHPSDIKIAELLDKHNLNGTFFVPIKNREGRDVLSNQQLRNIGKQFEIGSHTYDHRYLQNIRIADAYFQIMQGKTCLEDVLGMAVPGFCYPGGKYRQEHIDMIRSAGFEYARTNTNLFFGPGKGPYEMGTTIQFYPHSKMTYFRNFLWAGDWNIRQDALRLALTKDDWLERLYCLFEWSCEHEKQFHLWTHSWEVDNLNAWPALDRFLAHVSNRIPVEGRLTSGQIATRFY